MNIVRSILAVLAGLFTIFVTHLGTDQVMQNSAFSRRGTSPCTIRR